MKRLILEIGSGSDLYGMDYTKAALRALDNALRHSSITLFRSLDIDHLVMQVQVTIGVQHPDQVDIDAIIAAIPRGTPKVDVVFGGQNIETQAAGDPVTTVVATCAVQAFVPYLGDKYDIAQQV